MGSGKIYGMAAILAARHPQWKHANSGIWDGLPQSIGSRSHFITNKDEIRRGKGVYF